MCRAAGHLRLSVLQGELEITTEAGSGKAGQPGPDGQLKDHVERMPFLMLALDLPPAPLYKDVLEKDIIPQVLRQWLGFVASHSHDVPQAGAGWQRFASLAGAEQH